MFEFVFIEHRRLALHAALLFAVGLFIALPVVRYRLRAAAWLPLKAFGLILRLMGPSPSLARVAGVIFAYNAMLVFAYMATGVHPLVSKIVCIWVGMNLGASVGLLRGEQEAALVRVAAAGRWRPGPRAAAVCGLLVLLLELPCFWFAMAMSISMGHAVQSGASYGAEFAARAAAYWTILAPLLLASASAEALAIRGSFRPGRSLTAERAENAETANHDDTTSTTNDQQG